MERMKDLTQQYVEQLENMVIDLREEKFELLEENKYLKEENEKLKKDLAETQKIGESRRQECKQLRKQYQHSMGFSDFGGYDEDEHIVKDENTYRDLDL